MQFSNGGGGDVRVRAWRWLDPEAAERGLQMRIRTDGEKAADCGNSAHSPYRAGKRRARVEAQAESKEEERC